MYSKETKLYITIISIVTIIAILTGLYIHILGGGFIFGSKAVNDTVSLNGEVNNIDINIDAAKIDIIYGNELSVSYNMPEKLIPEISLDNGKLSVKSKKIHSATGFNPSSEYKLSVTIPEGTNLDNFSINSDAGNINIRQLIADDLSICTDAGNLELSDVTSKYTKVEIDAGNIDINNCNIDKSSIELDAGNIDIKNSMIDKLTAEIDAGNIESSDSTINSGSCNTDLGNINLNGNIGDVDMKTSIGTTEKNEK